MNTRRRGRGEGSIVQRADGRWMARVDLGWQDGKRRRKRSTVGPDERSPTPPGRAESRGAGDLVADERQTMAEFLKHGCRTWRARASARGPSSATRRRSSATSAHISAASASRN